MIDLLLIGAGILGLIVVVYLLAPERRTRGVKDPRYLQQTSDSAESEIGLRRTRFADNERRRYRQGRY